MNWKESISHRYLQNNRVKAEAAATFAVILDFVTPDLFEKQISHETRLSPHALQVSCFISLERNKITNVDLREIRSDFPDPTTQTSLLLVLDAIVLVGCFGKW